MTIRSLKIEQYEKWPCCLQGHFFVPVPLSKQDITMFQHNVQAFTLLTTKQHIC